MMIVEITFFAAFLLFFILLPSFTLFDLFDISFGNDFLTAFGLLTTVGIIFLTLFEFFIRYPIKSFQNIWVIPVISALYILWKRKNCLKKLKNLSVMPPKIILITVILGIITQNLVLYRGGWKTNGGYMFPSLHDTMWNISMEGELLFHYPPQHPGMAGEPLKNNHYFYPLFLASINFVTGINTFDLYFRLAPFLVSLLFGIGLYSFIGIFTSKKLYRSAAVFLGYFSGNLAYLLPVFLGSHFDWKGSSFFSDQPFDQIINPYSVLGFTILLFGLYAFHKALTVKRIKFISGWDIICGLLIGTLYGFKSFGGVIAISALGLTSLYYLIIRRDLRLVTVFLMSLLFLLPIFFITTEPGKASLHWAPGWILTEMVSGRDKLNLPKLAEIENYYLVIKNVPGLIKIKLIEFSVYLIGNLGIRILGILYLIKKIFLSGRDKQTEPAVILFSLFCITVAFGIPLLFNLGGNAYNVIQFTPYSLVLSAVLSPMFIQDILDREGRKSSGKSEILIILIILILAVPVNIKNIISKFENPKDIISVGEMDSLKFLMNIPDKNGTILINPAAFGYDPIYVSALSGKRLYLASSGFALQTGRDPAERLKNISLFFSVDSLRRKNFISRNNIRYVYLKLPGEASDADILNGDINLKPIFRNSSVIILETNGRS